MAPPIGEPLLWNSLELWGETRIGRYRVFRAAGDGQDGGHIWLEVPPDEADVHVLWRGEHVWLELWGTARAVLSGHVPGDDADG